MAQKTPQNSLRNMALTASKAYRTKPGITVPEWDGAKVTLREPSGDAWVKFREILNPEVFLDENGHRVFNNEDQKVVSEIYGPVHARLLAQAINLGMSQEEAGKP